MLAYTPASPYIVITTTLIVQCLALLHCSTNQISVECCLEFTTRSAIECFLGCLSQLSPSHWRRLVMSHAPRGFIHAAPHSLARQAVSPPVSRGSDISSTKENTGHFPYPCCLPKNQFLGLFQDTPGSSSGQLLSCSLT